MKIIVNRTDLLKAAQTADRFSSPRTSMPILAGVRLVTKGDAVAFVATDFEVGTIVKIPANVVEPGDVIVVAKMFAELVRALPDGDIEISVNDTLVEIKGGAARFTLVRMSGDGFPKVSIVKGTSFTIKGEVLKTLARNTSFACAVDESRPIFTGALLDLSNNEAKMVGTNVHRLAIATAEGIASDGGSVILPKRILDEVQKAFSDESDIQVSFSKTEASFLADGILLTTRLIEGSFPDLNRAIPKEFSKMVTVDSAALNAAVTRVGLIAKTSDYNTIKMSFSDGQVEISSTNPLIGNASEVVRLTYVGDPMEISFNASYVIDALKVIKGDAIFAMNEPLKPVEVRPASGNGFLYILTPVRMKA